MDHHRNRIQLLKNKTNISSLNVSILESNNCAHIYNKIVNESSDIESMIVKEQNMIQKVK